MTEHLDHPGLEFRVETLQNLLDHLCSALNGELDPDAGQIDLSAYPSRSERVLYRAGLSSGQGFGMLLKRDLVASGPASQRPTDEELLAQWCDYDSSTGWSLKLEEERESRHDRVVWCTIRAEENPFGRRDVAGTDAAVPEQNLCPFFCGYITGVTSTLLEADIRVEHPGKLCMFVDRTLAECRFIVSGSRSIRHPLSERG